MKTNDLEVGHQVRELRESNLMSQKDLAKRMRQAGTKWSQTTVWSVEAGDRPLRLVEAIELAEICGADPSVFFAQAAPESSFQRGVEAALGAVRGLLVDHD